MSVLKSVGVMLLVAAAGGGARGQVQAGAAVAGKDQTTRIDFKGGSLGAFVDSLRVHFPSANIVVDGPVAPQIVLPGAPLPRVTLSTAMQWILGTWTAKTSNVSITSFPATRDSTAVFVISAPPAPDESALLLRYTPSMPARPSDLSEKAIQGVINVAFSRKRDEERPKVHYDSTISLFTVTGGTLSDRNAVMRWIDERVRATRDSYVSTLLEQVKSLTTERDSLRRRLQQNPKS